MSGSTRTFWTSSLRTDRSTSRHSSRTWTGASWRAGWRAAKDPSVAGDRRRLVPEDLEDEVETGHDKSPSILTTGLRSLTTAPRLVALLSRATRMPHAQDDAVAPRRRAVRRGLTFDRCDS